MRRWKAVLRCLPVVRRHHHGTRSLRQRPRRRVVVVDIAQHEGAGVEVEDQRPWPAGGEPRRVDPRPDVTCRAGNQPHFHVDALIVVTVAHDAAQRHVQRRLRPRLRRAQRFDRLAAHLRQYRQHMPHVGIEPLGRHHVVRRRHRVPPAVGGEPAHFHRCHGDSPFELPPRTRPVRPWTSAFPSQHPRC